MTVGIGGATVVALGLAVLAGSVVQSSVGFGLAVVAAPFVVVLAPDLMPGRSSSRSSRCRCPRVSRD